MKSKRNKPKKYVVGGMLQAGLAVAQAGHGMYQRQQAKKEFSRLKASAPSMATPEQYYENYKNAYDSTMAKMEADSINRAYATSIQSLEGAGGRALVGGLGSVEAQRQAGMNNMLNQERQMRASAGADLAAANSTEQQYKMAQHQQDLAQVGEAFQAGTQNIGNALTSGAQNAMYAQMTKNLYGDQGQSNTGGGISDAVTKIQNGILKTIIPKEVQNALPYIGRFESGGQMTEGEFSHKKNPIHLIQNGEKVGEATGGEFILNPQQAKAIANESSYAKKLFKKFAANAKKGK